MGLLDDAIREHLELKRRSGADPDEVAREQREALDPSPAPPLRDESQTEEDASSQVSGAPLVDPTGQKPAVASPDEEFPPVGARSEATGRVEPSEGTEPVAAGGGGMGETAELDMSSVLGENADHEAAVPSAPAARAPAEADPLEWEMPGDGPAAESEEPDEDVLEETPEFLRETPEQERLWFEQRPPRDFDFDK